MDPDDSQQAIKSYRYIHTLIKENLDEFLSLREQIVSHTGIQRLPIYNNNLYPLIEGSRIERLNFESKLDDRIRIAFCGENSSGKTAFLHCFLGIGKILPSGDGPVTARITRLTYARADHAHLRILKNLRDQTVLHRIDLSDCFRAEKPNWTLVRQRILIHVERPKNLDPRSLEFADWARCLVEIYIPSTTLGLEMDVYDTPGFFLDDAPVLKEILHDLVSLVGPTIIFMYANPSTDDATTGCFLALKHALEGIDKKSMFYLNTKADINYMSKFRENMSMHEFNSILADERNQRYRLFLRAPFLSNDRTDSIPESLNGCSFFDICSINSQSIKPFGPLMNKNTFDRIIQYANASHLMVRTRSCGLILPIVEAFFKTLSVTNYYTHERIEQSHADAMNWVEDYFDTYSKVTSSILSDMFTRIMKHFDSEKDSLIRNLMKVSHSPDSVETTGKIAVRIQIINPAIRQSLERFKQMIDERISKNSTLQRGPKFTPILEIAFHEQQTSDLTDFLFEESNDYTLMPTSTLYMVNTMSIPIFQCAKTLKDLNFSVTTPHTPTITNDLKNIFHNRDPNRRKDGQQIVQETVSQIQQAIKEKRNSMFESIRLWGEQQKAVLKSIIDLRCKEIRPFDHSHEEILNDLKKYQNDFIRIECNLWAAQSMAQFAGYLPVVKQMGSLRKTFTTFIIDWGNERNLFAKKLTQPLPNQPIATCFEAHYHREITKLDHSNMIKIKYLYKHRIDDQNEEFWMIFPPIKKSLATVFEESNTLVLPLKTVVQWVYDIGHALFSLHTALLAHRNVTPSNIIVDEENHVALIDIGDWNEDSDLSMRHQCSFTTLTDTNDDVRGLGHVGLHLAGRIPTVESEQTILVTFQKLMTQCTQTTRNYVKLKRVMNELQSMLNRL